MTAEPTFEDFAAQFGDHEIPDELTALWEFSVSEAPGEYYSDGFELGVISKDGLRTWSEDPEFLDGVIEFAQADGSGSTYGFWSAEARMLSESPIVTFGSDGGTQVVAADLRDLLRLLGYDGEPFIDHDGVEYYRRDDDEHSERHESYTAWLRDRLQLEPATEPGPLVEAARAEHQERFDAWTARFTS